MSGLETTAASQFFYSTLSGDSILAGLAPGGIWDGVATDATQYPLVQFQMMSAVDLMVVGAFEVWEDQLWLVRGVHEAQSYADPLSAIAKRIHDLLHRKIGVTVAAGQIVECVRENTFRQGSVEGARQFRHLGGIYRLRVQ